MYVNVQNIIYSDGSPHADQNIINLNIIRTTILDTTEIVIRTHTSASDPLDTFKSVIRQLDNCVSEITIYEVTTYGIFTLSPDLSRFKSTNNKPQLYHTDIRVQVLIAFNN